MDSQRVAIQLNAQSLSQQRTSQNSGPKSEDWKEYHVKNGDTLAQVFRNNQLSMADLSALVKNRRKRQTAEPYQAGATHPFLNSQKTAS